MCDNDDCEEFDENEPWYEAEDCGCLCIGSGFASDWEWIPELGCYRCSGCGNVQ